MSAKTLLNLLDNRIHSLPLAIVYLTDKCNSRCVMCDYWKHGQTNISLEMAEKLAAEFEFLGTHQVLLSGGEPLQHPEWEQVARILAGRRRRLWLLTSGLGLEKHAEGAARLCQTVTVSLDAADGELYRSIRGVDGFERVCAGIQHTAALGTRVTLRCTIQRRNFGAMPDLVRLAHQLGAAQISFLAVDTISHVAFARHTPDASITLGVDDLEEFAEVLNRLEAEFAPDFESGFIAERPEKLRRLQQYFAAAVGKGTFPSVRCNAPRFSAVFTPDGGVQPCFFISNAGSGERLNAPTMTQLRTEIGSGSRVECQTCVCSMYRGVRDLLMA